MHVLLDHLAATVVGAVVLLMLLGIGVRMSQAGTDQQIYETSQRMAQSLAQQLEGDLLNVGYGVPVSAAPVISWTDSTFAFRRRAGLAPTDPVLIVEYRRVTRGTTTDDDGVTSPVYELERYENGVRNGGTTSTLAAFELDLLDASGAETAVLPQVVAVRVRFVTTFGSGADHAENGSRYSRTFHPANLAL